MMNIVHYDCLCKTMEIVLKLSRIVGILPIIIPDDHKKKQCTFVKSKKWLIYSYFLQFLMIIYMVVTYTSRYMCGPTKISNGMEWYVMSFGYFIGDLESLISLLIGVKNSSRICNLLIASSRLLHANKNIKKFGTCLKRCCIFLSCSFTILFTSYVYMGILRFDLVHEDGFLCTLLGKLDDLT